MGWNFLRHDSSLEGNHFYFEGVEIMKKTLITIGLTTVVVLTLVALVASLSSRVHNTFGAVNNSLSADYGMGGGGGTDLYAEAPAMPAPMDSVANRAAVPELAVDATTLKSIATNNASAQQERKVIKNDQLSLLVKDPAQSMNEIVALAEQNGGYAVSSNLYQTTYGPNNISIPQAQVVVRVPAEKLTDITDQIKKGAVEVQSENLSGQDVTDQYVDLQSRLAADQAAADQLTKIMQDATKPEDVLNVYNQLRQIQSDIEVLKGQIKYIDQSTATSEISVTLNAEAGAQPIEVGGWKIQGTAKESIQQLVFFLQGFIQFLIRFFLNYLWRLVLIGLLIYVLYLPTRAIYRRVVKPKAVAEVVTEEEKK